MPSKPPDLNTWPKHQDINPILQVSFHRPEDRDLFDTWLSEHGWEAFQDFYELQEVKNEPSPDSA